ncbi:hypothetical protein AND4_00998 [Vibrio sp. AND4]|nr:hypothetical protein AND4_00998 [Vibrio sp. AND4]
MEEEKISRSEMVEVVFDKALKIGWKTGGTLMCCPVLSNNC